MTIYDKVHSGIESAKLDPPIRLEADQYLNFQFLRRDLLIAMYGDTLGVYKHQPNGDFLCIASVDVGEVELGS